MKNHYNSRIRFSDRSGFIAKIIFVLVMILNSAYGQTGTNGTGWASPSSNTTGTPPGQYNYSGSTISPFVPTGSAVGSSYNWNYNQPLNLGSKGTGNNSVPVNTNTTQITTPVSHSNYRMMSAVTDILNYTGAMQTWVVPPGVTSIDIEAIGASGGTGATGGNVSTGGPGGKGTKATGTLSVTPGQVLNIFVGGSGITPTGGFNGGGNGGSTNAGGGGGASDVRYPGTGAADRIIVGAGGGGGGRAGCEGNTVGGGTGGNGDANGANGTDSPTSGGVAGGGFAGVGAVHGEAGIGCGGFLGSPGSDGNAIGVGGDGGAGQSCCCFSFGSIPGGGGGGGGFNGGGGGGGGSAGTTGCSGNDKGAGGGGAGGASYTGGVTSGATVTGFQTGDGLVKITYNNITEGTATPATQTVCSGSTITTIVLTATIPGTTFAWTRDNNVLVTGIAANGAGDISGSLTNTSNVNQTVTFTIIPTSAGVPGLSFTAEVIVAPEVTVDQPSDLVFCDGELTSLISFTSPIGSATFDWTNDDPSIGLGASGSGDIPSFMATNPGPVPVVATITVTPSFNFGGGGGTVVETFNYTGSGQTWVVPAGVTSIDIEAIGASGGTGATGGNVSTGGPGGKGTKATGTLSVTPGQVLNIFVGGSGITPTGGFNGGGNGGSTNAGGGGGASDVRYPGAGAADRIIVGAGGGGGGRAGCEGNTVGGGTGGNGDANGANGTDSPTSGGVAGGGFAGVGATHGAAGIGCGGFLGSPGSDGNAIGVGGDGGAGQSCCCFTFGSIPGGGGGGGGFNGGGGGGGGSAGTTGCSGNDKGAGGGGAGGASYAGGVTSGAMVTGFQTGDGVVRISYNNSFICTGTPKTFTITVGAPSVDITTNTGSSSFCKGSSLILDAGSFDSYLWSTGATTQTIATSSGATFTVTVTNAGGCTATASETTIRVLSVPNRPGTINGPVSGLCNTSGNSFWINPVANTDSYLWTVTNGIITSGQGTTAITVDYFGFSSSTITVRARNVCGFSSSRSLTVNAKPAAPLTIHGQKYGVCKKLGEKYNVDPVDGATSYRWTVPSGVTIVSGQNTTDIEVNFGNSFSSGSICCRAQNACGNSSYTCMNIHAKAQKPVIITGPTSVCRHSTHTYSTPSVYGATTYLWSVPSGAVILSGQGTPTITVKFGTRSGKVEVWAKNSCGTSDDYDLNVRIVCREEGSLAVGEINIYPNPTQGNLNLNITSELDQKCIVRLVDLVGRQMMLDAFDVFEGDNIHQYDVSGYAKGLYFMVIERDGLPSESIRVILQ